MTTSISAPATRPQTTKGLGGPEWTILAGSVAFIVVLLASAVWQADIRWLHFFQAWTYLATIALGLRRDRWGYFIGVSAAGLWDYTNLFVTTFLANGVAELVRVVRTGVLARPDQLIAVVAWSSNLAVVIGCVWGYQRLQKKRPGDLVALLAAFVATTAFFAGAMALFQPRYLALFPRMLHPSLPF